MNTDPSKIIRTNKTSTTVIIGAITLAVGLAIGVMAAESGAASASAKGQTGAATTNQLSSSVSNLPPLGRADAWNPFQEIRDMQARMDRMFNEMNQQFQGQASFHGFNDVPGYSLSLDVRDLKDRYEVHAYLPDAKASDVHVSLSNNQTLNVEVNRQQVKSSDKQKVVASVTELGQYEESIQLPDPVKADQMKITRNGHDLLITIPKAT